MSSCVGCLIEYLFYPVYMYLTPFVVGYPYVDVYNQYSTVQISFLGLIRWIDIEILIHHLLLHH